MIDYVSLAKQRATLDIARVIESKQRINDCKKKKANECSRRWKKKQPQSYWEEANRKAREKRRENSEKVNAQQRARRSTPEGKKKMAEANHKYYYENIEKCQKWSRDYAREHKAERAAVAKIYRENNSAWLNAKNRVRSRIKSHPELLEEKNLRQLFEEEFEKAGIQWPESKRFNDWLIKKEIENGNYEQSVKQNSGTLCQGSQKAQ